ncbi:MAG: hypothetical protein KDA84_25390 [Planctomycetaceae bacterium]|nr:hypothetical protein [Planctomycetaceae bacterium]
MARKSIADRLARLAAQEVQFLGQEFLAPVALGGEVRVRMASVICRMQIEPKNFTGWGVFEPISLSQAKFRREPTLTERQAYLRLFPQLSLLLCERSTINDSESIWYAMMAYRGDSRFQIEGLVPVRIVEDAEQFDVIRSRYDGSNFWFDSNETTRDLATADSLRKALRGMLPPDKIKRSGLTPEERSAYKTCWKIRQVQEKQNERDQTETRLRSALSHAGADFVDYLERGDGYRVTYRVGNRTMTTSVDKQTLNVQVAGICLSGEDQKFDLSSLVGVLREGGNHTVAIGQDNQGMSEDQYWSMYRR